jgi:hypothetical protein
VLESLVEDDAKNGNFHLLPAVGDKAGLEKLRSVAAMLPLTGLDRFIDPVAAVEDGSPARACAEASARAKAVVRRISGTPLTLGLANKTIDMLQLATYELSAWAKSKEDAQRIVDDMRGCLAEAEEAGKRRAMEQWLESWMVSCDYAHHAINEANTRITCGDFLQKRRLRLRRVQTPQAERGSLL